MSSITVRKLSPQTKERLRVRAAGSGVSLEAYARQALQRAADEPEETSVDIVATAEKYFGAEHGFELDLPPRGTSRPVVSFDA